MQWFTFVSTRIIMVIKFIAGASLAQTGCFLQTEKEAHTDGDRTKISH